MTIYERDRKMDRTSDIFVIVVPLTLQERISLRLQMKKVIMLAS